MRGVITMESLSFVGLEALTIRDYLYSQIVLFTKYCISIWKDYVEITVLSR